MHRFERELLVSCEEIEFHLTGWGPIVWAEHLLNPRRLRGSDFLMRWSQGVWSETRLVQAVNATREFFAIAYGPSGTAPDGDVRAYELYFEELEAAGLGNLKRPDLLIFQAQHMKDALGLVSRIGGETRLPFTKETEPEMQELLRLSILGVECENSLWVSRKMKGYGAVMKPMKRLGGKLGVSKSLVLPTVIVKEEDRMSLDSWQRETGVPIHIWHAFYDDAYGLSFDRLQALILEGSVEPTVQIYQAAGGATTKKVIYKTPYHHAYRLGTSQSEPTLKAAAISDANGHLLPYVCFEGGGFELTVDALETLRDLAKHG